MGDTKRTGSRRLDGEARRRLGLLLKQSWELPLLETTGPVEIRQRRFDALAREVWDFYGLRDAICDIPRPGCKLSSLLETSWLAHSDCCTGHALFDTMAHAAAKFVDEHFTDDNLSSEGDGAIAPDPSEDPGRLQIRIEDLLDRVARTREGTLEHVDAELQLRNLLHLRARDLAKALAASTGGTFKIPTLLGDDLGRLRSMFSDCAWGTSLTSLIARVCDAAADQQRALAQATTVPNEVFVWGEKHPASGPRKTAIGSSTLPSGIYTAQVSEGECHVHPDGKRVRWENHLEATYAAGMPVIEALRALAGALAPGEPLALVSCVACEEKNRGAPAAGLCLVHLREIQEKLRLAEHDASAAKADASAAKADAVLLTGRYADLSAANKRMSEQVREAESKTRRLGEQGRKHQQFYRAKIADLRRKLQIEMDGRCHALDLATKAQDRAERMRLALDAEVAARPFLAETPSPPRCAQCGRLSNDHAGQDSGHDFLPCTREGGCPVAPEVRCCFDPCKRRVES